MTKDSITNLVCSKVGKTDTTSVTNCGNYVEQRYQMIWDSFLWTESKKTVVQSLVAGTNTITVDSTIELVTEVIWDTYPLRNIDIESLYRTKPNWTAQNGAPIYYICKPKSGSNCILQIDAMPTVTKNVIITGKMVFTPLASGTSTPLLRGIDNTLISFVEGDMLQYCKLYGTADKKYAEAKSMLDRMIDLERNQQTQVAQMIPMKHDWDTNDLITTTQGLNNDTYFLRGS